MRCVYYALYQGKLGPVVCLQLLAVLEISWNLIAAGNFLCPVMISGFMVQ